MFRQASLFERGPALRVAPDTFQKLRLLTAASRFDLAGSCAKDPQGRGRKRGPLGRWVYPVVLPNGRTLSLFRTLLSNVCFNDCAYCPLRADRDPPRVSLSPEEIVQAFMGYFRRGWVHGLFLSSGVVGNPDLTMKLLIQTAEILRRREGFKGYIHLKVIPGASVGAIEEAARWANALSLNIEAPSSQWFKHLSQRKKYEEEVIYGLKVISRLRQDPSHKGLSQTTQFVVGAAGETDASLIRCTEALYKKLGLNRVYFSAYQAGCGRKDLPGENLAYRQDLLTREHRLYQVDFLLRKYGFSAREIPLNAKGFLDLDKDPKMAWAEAHPEFFPVNVNRASYRELLRVPGIGPTLAKRIITLRKEAKLKTLEGLLPQGKLLERARRYLIFS